MHEFFIGIILWALFRRVRKCSLYDRVRETQSREWIDFALF